jgi:aromatic-L-amino-acid decarboxylase
MSADYPLEPTGQEFRARLALVADRLAEFLDTLSDQPAANLADAESLARQVLQPAPERGGRFAEILEQLFERVFPVALNTTGPGYLAYIPGGGLPDSALADLIALVVNRYPGLWSVAPVVASIEAAVIRWFCELVGWPATSGGFLTSGGSIANWTALVAARELRMPDDFARGVIYTSNQAHHSVAKAAMLAGIPRPNLRLVPVDDQLRVCCKQLRDAIHEDRNAGRLPLAIVAHAGTTNTGAVDDLTAVGELAEREHIWLHVDAAYGGFFLLTERGRQALRGIDRADSITLDPHKGLFLPYGTGCLLIKDRAALARRFTLRGEYMTAMPPADEFVDFCDLSPELSRDFRGLRVWLPWQMHGTSAFRECLDEKLDLTRYVESALQQVDGIELMARSPLSIVTFRLRRPEWNDSEWNDRNREFLARINAGQRVLLTSTLLSGQFVIRICILSFRTHRDRIDECLAAIRAAAVC